ncbi:MAG: transposase [Leptospiraceae bacterium]|nr:transposase [Leptospiraceae bacterium]
MRYIGIDVAKDTFDVAFPSSNSNYKVVQFVNNEEGVKKFIKKLKQDDRSVLEATGSYSTLLTKRIMESGFEVSVVNPLQDKYFSKMTLRRTKSDASDAEMIAEVWLERCLRSLKSLLQIALTICVNVERSKVNLRNCSSI